MSTSLRRRLLLAALAPALSVPALGGCGFALRRSDHFSFHSLHIQDDTGASATLPLLKQALAATPVRITTGPADVRLRIHSDTSQQHTAALAAGGSVRALLLQQQLVFSVHSHSGAVLLQRTTIESTRHISYSDSLAVAKQAELEQTYAQMRQDIVRQLLRRLEGIPNPNSQ